MLGEGDRERLSSLPPIRKTFSRSVSWTGWSPSQPNPNPKPQWNSKARACLPPLQPLSINRAIAEEWPKPGSDDLGVWNAPPTPGAKAGSTTPCENSNVAKTPVEFEFKKDKLAFFNKECSRIVDYIYLGSDTIAKDREVLRENRITHVLNCVGFLCPEYFKGDLVYKTLWLQDSPSEDITSILYDVFDYFEEVREQGGRVFVHCCQGVSRSTSLVIAYLMWKEGQSFEDAFQDVKAARGVTNPNMGFACQLLQCQKRVHALPASPSSVIRMYRMAPHSPYDPLHLVPKLLCEPGPKGLDSRGAFIVHVPSAIYVWIGKHSASFMSDAARAAADQVIHYERAKGPVTLVKEGDEPSEFWDALGKEGTIADSVLDPVGTRNVSDYDLDFDIFHKALAGGVVPPFQLSGNGSETHLPARQHGWSRLRRRFANGIMKELIKAEQGGGNDETVEEAEYSVSSSPPQCDSPIASTYVAISPTWIKPASPVTESSLSRTLSSVSRDSFHGAKSNTTSPSLSPSTSDYSSSFTFSPTSSNWSDLSHLSAQPSPSELESKAKNLNKNSSIEEAFSASHDLSPWRERSVSLAERRGNVPPPRMMLPSVDEASQLPENLIRSWSFALPDFKDEMVIDCDKLTGGSSSETSREETMIDADTCSSDDDEIQRGEQIEQPELALYHWPSLQKVEICYSILDSSSVYIMSVPATTDGNILYVWIGRDSTLLNGFAHLEKEKVGHDFIAQKGFATTSLIQVVNEGEEPELLLKHLPYFSFQNTLDTGIQDR